MLQGESMGVQMKVVGVGDAGSKAVDFMKETGYEIEYLLADPKRDEPTIDFYQMAEPAMILFVISGLESDEVSKFVADIGGANNKEDMVTIFIHVKSYVDVDERKRVQSRIDTIIPAMTSSFIIKNEQLWYFKRDGACYTNDVLVNHAYFQTVVAVSSPVFKVSYIGTGFDSIVELYSPLESSRKGNVCLFGFGRSVGEKRAVAATNQAIDMLGIDLADLSSNDGLQEVMIVDEDSLSMDEYDVHMSILYDKLDEGVCLSCALPIFEEQTDELCIYLVVRQS